MLFHLLSASSDSGVDGSTVAATILAFVVFFGLIIAGIVGIIVFAVKSGGLFVTATQKEVERLYCDECPFTGENLSRKVLKDNSYTTEVKEVERYRVTGYGNEVYIDKNPTIQKTGGEYVQGDKTEQLTSKTYGYVVTKSVKYTVESGDRLGYSADDTYDVTTTIFTLDNVGTLSKKQITKLKACCRKNSSVSSRFRY